MRRSAKLFLQVLFATALVSCGGGGGGTGDASTIGNAGPVIAPLGQPRIMVSDPTTLASLQAKLANGVPSAVRFRDMVDQQLAGADFYNFEPWNAALMAKLTGNTSYCTYAVAQTDQMVASEEALIAGGQPASVASDVYLDVGPIVGGMALVYDWCRPQMTDDQRTRWKAYGNQAVWNLWLAPVDPHTGDLQAQWGGHVFPWNGWSLDNPVNNYYYSFLQATMLLGLATQGENDLADTWINQFRNVKLQNQLFPTFQQDLTGGGSREGDGYGVAMKNLWLLYYWWEKSTGERIADKVPHTLASMAAMLHNIVPTLDRITPTGDHTRDSTAALFDYHRDYLQILMTLFPNERLSGAVKSVLAASSVPTMSQHFMMYSDFLFDQTDIPAQPMDSLATAYYASGTGQFAMRGAWAADAAYANFICGPYTEVHAHEDQGSFTIYRKAWLAYDANIDTHDGTEQEPPAHNLVSFVKNGNPVDEVLGASPCNMLAVADNAQFTYASADITPIFHNASVVKSQREFVFLKPGTFVVFDRTQTAGTGMSTIWNLNLPGVPTITGDTLTFANGPGQIKVTRIAPAGVAWQAASWGGAPAFTSATATHVHATAAPAASTNFLHVIGTSGSVVSALTSSLPGQTGVEIQLNDGRTATVRFNDAAPGGTVQFQDANGVVTSQPLPTGIQALPLFAN